MKFEWDRVKNRSNLAKHGLDFEDAETVLAGPCFTVEDHRFDYGEVQLITVGMLEGRAVVIAHSTRGEST